MGLVNILPMIKKMKNLDYFARVYDDVISPDVCEFLIQTFENNNNLHQVIRDDKKPNFTQFNLTENKSKSSDIETIHEYLISKVIQYKKSYYDLMDDVCFPSTNLFEQLRIKRYINNGEELFDTHVDVADYSGSRRFLSFLFYLNDVSEGGETTFDGLTITPKAGRMLIFPPIWLYPHKGHAPISNNKYIMSTYLHYI